jgi:CRP-like cAMP-binding protein
VEYRRGHVIFTQGDPCESVLYIPKGRVKLSVLSKTGREAVVAMLGPGAIFAKEAWRVNPSAWERDCEHSQHHPRRGPA